MLEKCNHDDKERENDLVSSSRSSSVAGVSQGHQSQVGRIKPSPKLTFKTAKCTCSPHAPFAKDWRLTSAGHFPKIALVAIRVVSTGWSSSRPVRRC